MKEYEIWIEGYSATGEHSDASFIGKAMGETFDEACSNFEYPDDLKNPYYTGDENVAEYFHRKGDKLPLDTNSDGTLRRQNRGGYSIWACMLFENEADARKSFG